MPNHWILVVREQRVGKIVLGALDILQNRVRNKFWAFRSQARGLKSIRKGDLGIFYASGRDSRDFVGLCRIASDPYQLPRKRREMLVGNPSYAVDLDDVQLFPEPQPAKVLVDQVKFVKNKGNWGAYFQGSAIRIPEEDFRLVVSRSST